MRINFYLLITSISILLIISCKKRNVDQYVDTTQLSTFKIQSKAEIPTMIYAGVPQQLQVIIHSKSIKWLENDVVYYLESSEDNSIMYKEDGTLITPETPLSYRDTLLLFEIPNIEKESSISIKLIVKDLKDPITPGKVVFQETFNFKLVTSYIVVVPAYLSRELFIEGTNDSARFVIFSNITYHNDIYVSQSSLNLSATSAVEFTKPNNHFVEDTRLATQKEIELIKRVMGVSPNSNPVSFPMYVSLFVVPFKCLPQFGNSEQIDLQVTSNGSLTNYTDTIHISQSPFQFSAVMVPNVFVLQPNVPLPYQITVDPKIDPKGKSMRNGYKMSFQSNNTNYFKLYKNNDTMQEKIGVYVPPSSSSLYALLDTLYYTQYNGGAGNTPYRNGATLAFTIQNGATKKTFYSYTVNIYEPDPIIDFMFLNFYATTSNAIPVEDNMYVSGGPGNLVTRPLSKKAYLMIIDENPYAVYNIEFYKTNLYDSKTLVDYQIYSNIDPNIVETLKISTNNAQPMPNTLSIINGGKGFPSNVKFSCSVVAQNNAQSLSDLIGQFLIRSVVYRAYPVWDPVFKDQEIVGGKSQNVTIFSK